MLTQLSIKNYAIIEQTIIQFHNGFSVITGETGAGKSILLDALSLILGRRADLSALRDTNQKCVIEATFSIEAYGLESFFEENDLDYESQTIIRREILPSGKSRAFINDSPTQLNVLQQLGNHLIAVHAQYQTQDLFDADFQMKVLDEYAGTQVLVTNYQKELKLYKSIDTELQSMIEKQKELIKEHDYQLFLLEELQNAAIKDIEEEEELMAEEHRLSNVEKITEHTSKALHLLNSEEFGVLEQLKSVKSELGTLSGTQPIFEEWLERIHSSIIEIDDIATAMEQQLEDTFADPQRLDFVQERLQLFQQLYKKHQVDSLTALLDIQEQLSQKIDESATIDDAIATLEQKKTKQYQEVEKIAREIREQRMDAIPSLQKTLETKIQPLGMVNTKFEMNLEPTDQFTKNGMDTLELLFTANKGANLGALKKTASGGELSRIMLVVQSILAEKSQLATLIFDEIDTGVSGDVANKMGMIMKEMATNMQLFSITHLPQVAAKGTYHYKVYKRDSNEQTTSEIILLDENERVEEIAQMLSGTTITAAAKEQAKELLTNNS